MTVQPPSTSTSRTPAVRWYLSATFTFDAGTAGCVRLSNDANLSYVIADAVKFQNTQMQIIPPDDPMLGIKGTLFARLETDGLWLHRFTEEILTTPTSTFSADRAQNRQRNRDTGAYEQQLDRRHLRADSGVLDFGRGGHLPG